MAHEMFDIREDDLRGFTDGEAFADYARSSFNQFLHLPLA
jgi:hypothetical protein